MNKELNSFGNRFFDFNWKLGLFLILIVCIPRFILVLYSNATKNYGFIGLVMVVSAITPFLFLSKHGRREIGLTKIQSYKWVYGAFVCGLAASVLLHIVGKGIYGNSFQNWYQYIGQSLNRNLGFVVLAIPSMIFSPIGEELFFRGIVHSSFTKSIGEKKASIVDSSAFALTHISHFGLVFINNQWDFFILPTLIWVTSMFLVSLLFFTFRKKTGSILGAMFCHSAFNLGMIFCIYYWL
jgi:uncharacterized protein